MTDQAIPKDLRLDPIAELGIELKQPIPSGQAFVDWLLDDGMLPAVAEALLARGFTWDEVARVVFDLSQGQWAPSASMLQGMTGPSE